MVNPYLDTYDAGRPSDSVAAKVRRYQAAVAIRMSLLTGRRIGEVLSLDDEALERWLGHGNSQVTERYISANKSIVGPINQDAVTLARLCSYYANVDAAWAAVDARDHAASPSPYSRVYQDQSRVDALSAHLSALRAQLKDEI